MIKFINKLFKNKNTIVEPSVLECDCKDVEKHNAEIITGNDTDNYRVKFCRAHLIKELEKGYMAEYLGNY